MDASKNVIFLKQLKIALLLFTLFTVFYCPALQAQEKAAKAAFSTAARTITFAGVTWNVKSGGPKGPGPNYWTDNAGDVWVDEQGRLHMTIIKKDNTWYCSEVYTTEFSTYGEHRFLVEGDFDRMDKQIVLGLFTYAADDAEVDIEFSKWGSASNNKIGGYTLQPYYITGNNYKFPCTLSSSKSTHYFNWQPDSVHFGSYQGHHYGRPDHASDVIQQWVYTGNHIPDSSLNLRTHINFWLFQGKNPVNFSVLHIIITDVVQPLAVSVSPSDQTNASPKRWQLEQNYPNPFNPITHIDFGLKEAAHVKLSVYNARGNKIKTLVDGLFSAGNHTADWNGANDNNSLVASGVYFYQIQVDDEKSTLRKMQFLK